MHEVRPSNCWWWDGVARIGLGRQTASWHWSTLYSRHPRVLSDTCSGDKYRSRVLFGKVWDLGFRYSYFCGTVLLMVSYPQIKGTSQH